MQQLILYLLWVNFGGTGASHNFLNLELRFFREVSFSSLHLLTEKKFSLKTLFVTVLEQIAQKNLIIFISNFWIGCPCSLVVHGQTSKNVFKRSQSAPPNIDHDPLTTNYTIIIQSKH